MYRYGFQVTASCARYGSLHQWPFIPDLLQVLFPFYFPAFSVYNVVYLGLHTFFFLKLLLLLKAFKMFMPDAVL